MTSSSPLPTVLRGAIFDMDGTLIDTEAAHQRAFIGAGEAVGWPLPTDVLDAMVGIHRDVNQVMLRQRFGPEFPMEAFYEEGDARFEAQLRKGFSLRPGAREILSHLADIGIPMALATSTVSPDAEERLEQLDLARFFEVVVTRSHVKKAKPDPEPYLLAANLLGVEPAECIAVEDSNPGVRSATRAGITTFMVPDLMGPDADVAALASAVLPDLHALRALLPARAVAG